MKIISLMLATAATCAAVPAYANFAAIAYSPSTGAWGSAYQYLDYNSAESTALYYCYDNQAAPTDCQIVAWVEDGCIALALDTNRYQPSVYGTAYANGLTFSDAFTPAQLGAVENCESSSGYACSIETTVCSF